MPPPLRLALAAGLFLGLAGCSPKPAATPTRATPPLAPAPAPTEQRWVIGAIARDLANMAAFAADAAHWTELPASAVDVRESAGAQIGSAYNLAIHLPAGGEPLVNELKIVRTVWAPEVYGPTVRALLQRGKVALPPTTRSGTDDQFDVAFLKALTNPLTGEMETQNARLSAYLQDHPLDAQAHDEAALLLGTLALRENSGHYWNPRHACNRAAAHLAFARALRPAPSECGEVAEVLIGLILDTKADCQARLSSLRDRLRAHPELRPWIMAATLRNTRDYRLLPNPQDATFLENIELFRAIAEGISPEEAIRRMPSPAPATAPDWSRTILQFSYSVGTGHRYALPSTSLELWDAAHIFPDLHERLSAEQLAAILNQEAGDAVGPAPGGGGPRWQVIDRGAWAQFFQRHLLHAADATYDFLQDKWGVPDQAKLFRAKFGVLLKALTLYPLSLEHLGRDEATDLIPRAAVLLARQPEEVSDGAWVRTVRLLAAQTAVAGDWQAQSRTWFSPSLPTGTVYGLYWRVAGGRLLPGLGLAEMKRLHDLAPLHYETSMLYLHALAPHRPSPEQFREVMGPLLPYYLPALHAEANLVEGDPAQYNVVMNQAAALDPTYYVRLSRYDVSRHLELEAAQAYQAAIDHHADPVMLGNNSAWLVNYYYDHGDTVRAVAVAAQAAAAYSSTGLQTYGNLMERMNRLPEAEESFRRVKDRYNDATWLTEFYARQAVHDPSYAVKWKAAQASLFPHGVEQVSLQQLTGRPPAGVLVRNENALSRQCGLKVGAIIVALDGKRVQSMEQYSFVRAQTTSPAMDLLVFEDDRYQAIHTSVPGRRFNLDFVTWPETPEPR